MVLLLYNGAVTIQWCCYFTMVLLLYNGAVTLQWCCYYTMVLLANTIHYQSCHNSINSFDFSVELHLGPSLEFPLPFGYLLDFFTYIAFSRNYLIDCCRNQNKETFAASACYCILLLFTNKSNLLFFDCIKLLLKALTNAINQHQKKHVLHCYCP